MEPTLIVLIVVAVLAAAGLLVWLQFKRRSGSIIAAAPGTTASTPASTGDQR